MTGPRRAAIGRAVAGVAVAIALSAGGSGCSAGSHEAVAEPVRLSQGDGCGEAMFWAATGSGDIAVVVQVDGRDRSRSEATTIPVDPHGDRVTVRILRGTDLTRNFCTDVILPESQASSEQGASAGSGEIVLQPSVPGGPHGCGTSDRDPNGTLRLTGLVADDGTTFAPITVETGSIGCYAG